MKSMRETQAEMLRGCRWDGGYPKVMHMGLGIIAVARDAEEESQLQATLDDDWKIWLGSLLVCLPLGGLLIWWLR